MGQCGRKHPAGERNWKHLIAKNQWALLPTHVHTCSLYSFVDELDEITELLEMQVMVPW